MDLGSTTSVVVTTGRTVKRNAGGSKWDVWHVVVRLQMGWFVFFLNEPLKDDFMSGYSQMAGLAAASLAGELQGFRFECLSFTSPKVLSHWNHSSANCSWRNWTAKIHEPTLKHCPGAVPAATNDRLISPYHGLNLGGWEMEEARRHTRESCSDEGMGVTCSRCFGSGFEDRTQWNHSRNVSKWTGVCLWDVLIMEWWYLWYHMISRYISAFNGRNMCKKLQEGRSSYQPHITWSHLKDAQKAKYIPSVRCFWGTLVAISHLKNSARGPRGLEQFLPGGTHAWIYSKGAIQRHQVPYICDI